MISQYQRILLQRNTLLKDISYAPSLMDTLDIWDEKLSALGGAIIRMRMEYTRRLQKQAADIYNGISMDRETVERCVAFRAGRNTGGMDPKRDLFPASGKNRPEQGGRSAQRSVWNWPSPR